MQKLVAGSLMFFIIIYALYSSEQLAKLILHDNNNTHDLTNEPVIKSELTYPRYLMIIKSSRVGSTFVKETFRKYYNSSLIYQWEGNGAQARAHFEKCGQLSKNTGGSKWVCTAHLNDRFRNAGTYKELVDLIQDYNASVVIQIRANAVEKAISMSKIWGVMKRSSYSNATRAMDVHKYSVNTLAFTRTLVHAAAHGFIPLPSPTQEKPLWIWYEDLIRSCKVKFAELFNEIGMHHLPPPPSCDEVKFRDEGPYDPIMVETLSKEPALVPMIDHLKFNKEVDTDAYRMKFENETRNITSIIFGTY